MFRAMKNYQINKINKYKNKYNLIFLLNKKIVFNIFYKFLLLIANLIVLLLNTDIVINKQES